MGKYGTTVKAKPRPKVKKAKTLKEHSTKVKKVTQKPIDISKDIMKAWRKK